MRIAMMQYFGLSEEGLAFCAQLGVSGVCLNLARIDGPQRLGYEDLVRYRERCEAQGLRLEAVENVPASFCEAAMVGGPERDAQVAEYRRILGDLGRAGVPILGLHWMPNFVWRTSEQTRGRGGAVVTAFDLDEVHEGELTHGRRIGEEELWGAFESFMEDVLPAAEEAGVRIALHPDDPPVASLGGVARIFRDVEGFRRAVDRFPSDAFGLNFCMGTWSEMGPGVLDAMRDFGERGKIVYGHFRNVKGHVPRFEECFLDEGDVDPVEAMQVLLDVGFDGFLLDDHVPRMVGDAGFNHRGRALSTGYMMGLLDALG